MTQFTDSLRRYYRHPQRAIATITAVDGISYIASTAEAGDSITLTASYGGNYAVGDSVFYDVKTREILGKSPATHWTDIYV